MRGHTEAMDATSAGLLGTAIGAVAGLAGSALTAWHQRSTERERLRAARTDEMVKAERQALLDLMKLLASGTQAIAWLAWAASVQPAEALRREIESYDARMRELLPQLLAAEAAGASLSDQAFERIDPLVRELTILDARVATAAAEFEADADGDGDADDSRQRLATAKDQAIDLSDRSVEAVRAILRSAAA